jgi:hypothetical protein
MQVVSGISPTDMVPTGSKDLATRTKLLPKRNVSTATKWRAPLTSTPSVEILPCVNKGKESLTHKPKPLIDYEQIQPVRTGNEDSFVAIIVFPSPIVMIERKNRGMGQSTPLIFKPSLAPAVHTPCPLPNFKNSGRDLCNLSLLSQKPLSQWNNFSVNLELEPRYAQSQPRQEDSLLREVSLARLCTQHSDQNPQHHRRRFLGLLMGT